MPSAWDRIATANARQELKHAAHAGRRLATTCKPPQGAGERRISPPRRAFTPALVKGSLPLAYTVAPTSHNTGTVMGTSGRKMLRDIKTGESPVVSYWKQAVIVSDNRLPALGSDTSSYTFAAPASGGRVTITAELRFRRAFAPVMLARGWSTDDIIMQQAQLDLVAQPRRNCYLPLMMRAP